MSSALAFVRRGSGEKRAELTRYPLRRVDSLLRRFFKVFQINLDRMQLHKLNIQKFISADDVSDLTREYVYTLHSVQQLTSTVLQIRQIRSQVEVDDLVVLDHRLTELFNGAILLLAEFLLLNNEHPQSDDTEKAVKLRRAFSSSDGNDSCKLVPSLRRQQSLVQLVPADRVDCLQAWTRLRTKMLDFNDTLQKLFLLIETHCSSDTELLSSYTPTSSDSHSPSTTPPDLKCLMSPATGAVLGGGVTGPVGIVTGLKTAKLVGSNLLGLTARRDVLKSTKTKTQQDAAITVNTSSELVESGSMDMVEPQLGGSGSEVAEGGKGLVESSDCGKFLAQTVNNLSLENKRETE